MRNRNSQILFVAPLLISMLLPKYLAVASEPMELLLEMEQRLSTGVYGQIDSLLIWQDDNLLMEEYYGSSRPNRLHKVYSTTKSVTSALVGIALEKGLIPSLDVNVLDYFSEYQPFENLDDRKRAITLEDLLKMQAGFGWDESSESYESPNNSVIKMVDSGQDWVDYVLDLEMVADPGTEFVYNSGVTMLLSVILEKATGQTVKDFAADTLFEDLGINRLYWAQTPFGYTNTGWGLRLQSLDMLKFGELYLNQGYLQPEEGSPGKQVVPAEWVEKTMQSYTDEYLSEELEGGAFEYGYQWWRFGDDSEVIQGLDVNDVYFTWGYGGQFIFVIPHLNSVIVATGGNFWTSDQLFPAFSELIFPALQQLAVPEPSTLFLSLLGLLWFGIRGRCHGPQ